MRNKPTALQKIRSIADYQFGKDVGERLFPDDVEVVYARTGRIRRIYLDERMLATLRPRDGLFSLTVAGAKRLWECVQPRRLWVRVQDEAAPFVVKGRSVFAKYVVDADEDVRPQEEVVVISTQNEVLAVGRAMLSGREMKKFKRGVAVKIRRGAAEEEES